MNSSEKLARKKLARSQRFWDRREKVDAEGTTWFVISAVTELRFRLCYTRNWLGAHVALKPSWMSELLLGQKT